jgi:hypothetical protein
LVAWRRSRSGTSSSYSATKKDASTPTRTRSSLTMPTRRSAGATGQWRQCSITYPWLAAGTEMQPRYMTMTMYATTLTSSYLCTAGRYGIMNAELLKARKGEYKNIDDGNDNPNHWHAEQGPRHGSTRALAHRTTATIQPHLLALWMALIVCIILQCHSMRSVSRRWWIYGLCFSTSTIDSSHRTQARVVAKFPGVYENTCVCVGTSIRVAEQAYYIGDVGRCSVPSTCK